MAAPIYTVGIVTTETGPDGINYRITSVRSDSSGVFPPVFRDKRAAMRYIYDNKSTLPPGATLAQLELVD